MTDPIDANELTRRRREKLAALRRAGVDPFGARYPVSDWAGLLRQHWDRATEEELKGAGPVSLAGRIMAVRHHGKSCFASLQDHTGGIQLYARADLLGKEYGLFTDLDIGDFVGVTGELFRTRTGELTVQVKAWSFLAKSLRPLPEKWHGLKDVETRYRQRYVDLLVNPGVREVFRLRSRLVQVIREFLDARGFLEVETPMMQPLPGGAAARPFVTHSHALDLDLYLRIAPELYLKRLVVGGLDRVYEINRNFRNEGISTEHNPEFTMLEFYQAYADYRDLMELTEELVVHLARTLLGGATLTYQGREIDLAPPWPRLSYLGGLARALDIPEEALGDAGTVHALAARLGLDILPGAPWVHVVKELFETVVEPTLTRPTFVIDFPLDLSPLAKRKKDASHLVERFELFIAQKEIANAYSELNDPIEQAERFAAQASLRVAGDEEAHRVDEDFLRALEYGMPPTAGEGIGIDRLVMLLADQASIRDVILFPLLRPEPRGP